jgi:putative MATE family efflux protein
MPRSLVDDPRPTWRLVLSLAWPVLVQQFLILSVGLYDQYLAGNNTPEDRALHVGYQAAQTTANYIAWFISSCSTLVCVGGTALVARFIGAGETGQANRVVNQSILLAAIFGILATPVSLALLPSIVDALNLTGGAGQSAVRFLQPILFLLTCQLVELAGIACLNGAGDTRTGPAVLGVVALINMPMAWICLHGFGPIPAMGFFGIGVGTAISHGLGAAIVLTVLIRGRYGLKLERRLMLPNGEMIRRILRVSIPASFDTLSIGVCQLWFLSLVNALGTIEGAAHGTAIRCEGLGYLSGQAFATAAATLVGQYLGAKQPQKAAHGAWVAFGWGCAAMTLMGVLFFTFAPQMFRVFSPNEHQAAVVEAGVPVLKLVAFAMPALAAIIVFTGALRGAGDTRFPILLTWIGFVVIRIPLAYFLTRASVNLGPFGTWPGWDMGLFGAWLAMFADLLIRGGLFLWRFLGGRWKLVRV